MLITPFPCSISTVSPSPSFWSPPTFQPDWCAQKSFVYGFKSYVFFKGRFLYLPKTIIFCLIYHHLVNLPKFHHVTYTHHLLTKFFIHLPLMLLGILDFIDLLHFPASRLTFGFILSDAVESTISHPSGMSPHTQLIRERAVENDIPRTGY